jgi:hypothetical protein
MKLRSRLLTPLAALTLALPLLAATPAAALIVLAAGEPSHGPGEHRFPAGARVLADALNASGLSVRAAVTEGWPDSALLRDAASLVLFSDGLDRHVAEAWQCCTSQWSPRPVNWLITCSRRSAAASRPTGR